MSKVLVVYCSMSGNTKAAAEAIAAGAKEAGGRVTDKPYAAFVTHGGGGRAIESIESIAKSFKLKKIADAVLIKGKPVGRAIVALKELGEKLATVTGE